MFRRCCCTDGNGRTAPTTQRHSVLRPGDPLMTYKIIRFYAPHLNKSNRVIQRGLTLEQAQEHCKNPSTRKAGEWFDGYDAE